MPGNHGGRRRGAGRPPRNHARGTGNIANMFAAANNVNVEQEETVEEETVEEREKRQRDEPEAREIDIW